MKPKAILLCLLATLALGACAGTKPYWPECGCSNCRGEKPVEPV